MDDIQEFKVKTIKTQLGHIMADLRNGNIIGAYETVTYLSMNASNIINDDGKYEILEGEDGKQYAVFQSESGADAFSTLNDVGRNKRRSVYGHYNAIFLDDMPEGSHT